MTATDYAEQSNTRTVAGLMEMAADGALTYLSRGRAGVTYQLWTSLHEYRLLTRRERRLLLELVGDGLLCRYPGGRLPRGAVGVVGPLAQSLLGERRSDRKRKWWQ